MNRVNARGYKIDYLLLPRSLAVLKAKPKFPFCACSSTSNNDTANRIKIDKLLSRS
jgi:hypothetical protein